MGVTGAWGWGGVAEIWQERMGVTGAWGQGEVAEIWQDGARVRVGVLTVVGVCWGMLIIAGVRREEGV